MSPIETDVVIVGAGPVGLTLANLLGQRGVRTVVLERNAGVEVEPRAVTLDDESLRTYQNAGLAEAVTRDVVLGYGVEYFGWNGKPFARIAPTSQEYGYPKRNGFRQPLLVHTLLAGLRRFACVEARFGHELVSFSQADDRVHCIAKRSDGSELTVVAQWLVACDGGRSPVRERCGIVLDGDSYAERWLIVDLAERTHPLRHTRTYCDPRRPAIRLPGPHRSVRYEFMLRPSDRDEQVLDEATFREWIAARVPEDRDLPLVRKVIYGFHARVATSWRQGRVLLAGDAAHLTPPFAGQGLNSGIRDATNLGWKLAAVVQGRASPQLMDSYEQERRRHAAALIRMAQRIGTYMQPKSIPGAIATQVALRLACLVPACRDYILQLRFKPKPRFDTGFFETKQLQPYAELLPQPLVEHPVKGKVLLDTLLGDGFALVGWDCEALRSAAARKSPLGEPMGVVRIIRQDEDFLAPGGERQAVRDCTGDLQAFLDRFGAAAVVVRPDRYVYTTLTPAHLAASAFNSSASAFQRYGERSTAG